MSRRPLSRRRPRPFTVLAGAALLAVSLLALLAPYLPLAPPDRTQTWQAYEPPRWSGSGVRAPSDDVPALPTEPAPAGARNESGELPPLFGRDALGRCVLSRICWGARISLATGVISTLLSLLIGVTYGAVSGLAGGRTDEILMRIVDLLYSIPFIFVVIFFITFLRGWQEQGGLVIPNLLVFFVVIALVYWLTMARVVRGQVVSLRESEFVLGARALGATPGGILRRHILPNISSVVIVYLTLTIPRVILFETFLSFLGLGVEPPAVSWGVLAREAFEVLNPVQTAWWLVLWPSVFLFATLASLNRLGDALRDELDPRTVS